MPDSDAIIVEPKENLKKSKVLNTRRLFHSGNMQMNSVNRMNNVIESSRQKVQSVQRHNNEIKKEHFVYFQSNQQLLNQFMRSCSKTSYKIGSKSFKASKILQKSSTFFSHMRVVWFEIPLRLCIHFIRTQIFHSIELAQCIVIVFFSLAFFLSLHLRKHYIEWPLLSMQESLFYKFLHITSSCCVHSK